MVFVSIVIPVYNVREYVGECVESVLRWSGDDIEVVLVDDGSTDGSGDVCDEYAARDARVRVVHQANQGVAAARNAGLGMARGKWVWFVDSDDYIDAVAAREMAERVRGRDCDFVQFGHSRVEERTGVVTQQRVDDCVGRDKNSFLVANMNYNHWRVWYRRDVIEKHELRFSLGLRMAEDLEFMYTYLLYVVAPMQYGSLLYFYRRRSGSAVNSVDSYKNGMNDAFTVLDHWIRRFCAENIKAEPWLDLRTCIFVKRLLYSARHIEGLDRKDLQGRLRRVLDSFKELGFAFPHRWLMRLAYRKVGVYMWANKIYQALR